MAASSPSALVARQGGHMDRGIRAAPRERGYTLVEIVVALAILAVLLSSAAPSFARLVAEQQLRNEARRLSDAILHARSEALKRNGAVVICASLPADPCGPTRRWHEGWLMFADADDDGTPGAAEPTLGHDGPAAPRVAMLGNRPVARYLRFDWTGRARTLSGALQMGTIEVCRPGLVGYHVVLANSGRTRIERMRAACP
jgi:type IV fimbrial biogenesis protein FimT